MTNGLVFGWVHNMILWCACMYGWVQNMAFWVGTEYGFMSVYNICFYDVVMWVGTN